MHLSPNNPHFIIEYHLTEEMADRLGRTMLDRYFYGRSFHRFAPLGVIAILGLFTLAYQLEFLTRDAFAFLLVVLAAMCGYAWCRRLILFQNARSVARLPLQGRQTLPMRLTVTQTLLSLRSAVENYEAEWEELAVVWVLPDFWILRFKTDAQLVLPLDALTPELEDFIRRKAAGANAGIVE